MSAEPRAGDRARVSVAVDVPPAVAFEVFTAEVDRWWRRGVRFRHSGTSGGVVHIEPRVGGRVFESLGEAAGSSAGTVSAAGEHAGEQLFEIGRVRVWDPPARLAFSWRNSNFAPDEITEVEVTFAPNGEGTLVTVTHTGWGALRDDHPARHGKLGAEFARMIGLWWGDQLTSLRMTAGDRPRV